MVAPIKAAIAARTARNARPLPGGADNASAAPDEVCGVARKTPAVDTASAAKSARPGNTTGSNAGMELVTMAKPTPIGDQIDIAAAPRRMISGDIGHHADRADIEQDRDKLRADRHHGDAGAGLEGKQALGCPLDSRGGAHWLTDGADGGEKGGKGRSLQKRMFQRLHIRWGDQKKRHNHGNRPEKE